MLLKPLYEEPVLRIYSERREYLEGPAENASYLLFCPSCCRRRCDVFRIPPSFSAKEADSALVNPEKAPESTLDEMELILQN